MRWTIGLVVALLVTGPLSADRAPAAPRARSRPIAIGQQSPIATLFTTTVPAAIPPATGRTVLLWYAIVGPGVRVTRAGEPGECCPGIQFTHGLSGAFALRGDGLLQVVRGDAGRVGSPETVAPRTEVVLGAGDTAVDAAELPTTHANPGTTTAHLVAWRLRNRVPPPARRATSCTRARRRRRPRRCHPAR